MTKKFFLSICIVSISLLAFSQDSTVKAHPKSLMIILSEPEVEQLFAFIMSSDNYSDKGKRVFIDGLRKKIYVVPDTVPGDKQKPVKKKN